jgi:hypothetical protein
LCLFRGDSAFFVELTGFGTRVTLYILGFSIQKTIFTIVEIIMGRRHKDRELAQKRKRKEKLKKYRKLFATAKTEPERQELQEKVSRISPFTVLSEG